jgi:hypothetical protein
MNRGAPQRFHIRFDPWYRWLSTALGLPPSRSYVDVDGEQVWVRMGWAFRCQFSTDAVASAAPMSHRPISRGVHGFAGRWLVNGSGQGILTIELAPGQRGYVMGVRVQLRQLAVSVADPLALATALQKSPR